MLTSWVNESFKHLRHGKKKAYVRKCFLRKCLIHFQEIFLALIRGDGVFYKGWNSLHSCKSCFSEAQLSFFFSSPAVTLAVVGFSSTSVPFCLMASHCAPNKSIPLTWGGRKESVFYRTLSFTVFFLPCAPVTYVHGHIYIPHLKT